MSNNDCGALNGVYLLYKLSNTYRVGTALLVGSVLTKLLSDLLENVLCFSYISSSVSQHHHPKSK